MFDFFSKGGFTGKPLDLVYDEDGNIIFSDDILEEDQNKFDIFREFIQQGCETFYDFRRRVYVVKVNKEEDNG